MPVDGPDIGKPQLFEQCAAHRHALEHFLGPARALLERLRQQTQRALGSGLQVLQRGFGIKAAEIARQRANRRGDRHFIVIQHHEQPLFQMARVVHRLKGHARAHAAIANHRDRITGIAAQIGGHGKAQRGADRGAGMGGTKRVKRAFRPFGEPR